MSLKLGIFSEAVDSAGPLFPRAPAGFAKTGDDEKVESIEVIIGLLLMAKCYLQGFLEGKTI
jgi:hypothetical protein